jgi:predicted GTPase
MNLDDPRIRQLADEVRRIRDKKRNAPLVVSIMGQTGVGKSSLINALFNTQLKTDPIRPCTKEIERVVLRGKSGHELWFYDLPGIGESDKADTQYLATYRQMLMDSDIALWAIHADNRSVAFDLDALHRILGSTDKAHQVQLMSRLTFILTKVDLLAPPPWILAKLGNDGVFVPQKDTEALLEEKEQYYQETFILPYKDLIVSETYHNGNFDLNIPSLSYDEDAVYYNGFLDKGGVNTLKKRFPKHASVFERLYDNYRVISCSSLFRFNLDLLMKVIINKLGLDAVERFSNFYSSGTMNQLPLAEAKKYRNFVVFDQVNRRLIFDLAKEI